MPSYVMDVESNGLHELLLRKEKGEYVAIPEATIIHLLVLYDLSTGQVHVHRRNDKEDTIREGWDRALKADTLVTHNGIQFDLPVMERLYGGEFKGKHIDTLVLARLLWPDAKNHPYGGNSVEMLGHHLGLTKIGTDITDWSKWTPLMEKRCVSDVKVQAAIFKWLLPKVKPFKAAARLEHRVCEIISRQQENGVDIDVLTAENMIDGFDRQRAECRDALYKAFPDRVKEMATPQYYVLDHNGVRIKKEKKKQIEEELQSRGHPKSWAKHATPGPPKVERNPFNPGSTNQIAERLEEKYGWVAPRTKAGNPSVTEDTLLTLDFPEADLIVQYNMADKRLQHLHDWVTRARTSRTPGRIHPFINTNGAATGRMTHSQPNQTACPRVVKDKKTGEFVRGFRGRYGWEMRRLWKPRPGWKFVGGDASGLELRMLGHALHPFDGGAYAKEVVEGDVHTLNMKAGGLDTRNQTKETFYAWIYGSGNETLGQTIADHQSLTPDQRKKYYAKERAKIGGAFKRKVKQKIPALDQLISWCGSRVKSHGYLVLPDGRHAPIRKEYAALNTLLQGTGAIVMKVALVLHHDELIRRGYRWDRDFGYCLNAHDEFQLETRPEIAEEVGQLIPWAIKTAGERLKIRCPLDGDYAVGDSWADTH